MRPFFQQLSKYVRNNCSSNQYTAISHLKSVWVRICQQNLKPLFLYDRPPAIYQIHFFFQADWIPIRYRHRIFWLSWAWGQWPCLHLVKISFLSLNNVTVRLTKIMNNLLEHLNILIFKVIFQCWKMVESFQKKVCEQYWTMQGLRGPWTRWPNFSKKFDF